MIKRVFSGIQPTGTPHLGNYIGAIKNWVNIQNDLVNQYRNTNGTHDRSRLLFCAVDLHALTSSPDPKVLRESINDMVASLMACGIDPKKSILYQQSMVTGHSELAWILNCLAPMGRLGRMTQFKEKSAGKLSENICLGLFSYPVLMSADILLFNASHVPVGNDQKQHLEFARDLAITFNDKFKTSLFSLPSPIIGEHARIMSLRDGKCKMSKSDPAESSRILISDSADQIWLKIKKAKTDNDDSITYDPENRPELANLIGIYSTFTEKSCEKCVEEFQGKGKLYVKEKISEVIVEKIVPIGKERERILNDGVVNQVLKEGAERASEIAQKTLYEVQSIVGIR